MKATFLDFDGVIIDSVKECFIVSKEQYEAQADKPQISEEHEKLFFKWRGITGPAWQFTALHRAIASSLAEPGQDMRMLFHDISQKISERERINLEKQFFEIRKEHQIDLKKWINLNPLTEYGQFLQRRNLENYHIVTTKNREAVELLLDHYLIKIGSIYDVEDYHRSKTKGVVISRAMDKLKAQEGIFVDDSVMHLDSVFDPRVACYFASWGYGENTTYPIFERQLW